MTTPRTDSSRLKAVSVALVLTGGIVGTILGVGLLAALSLYADGPGGFPYYWDAFILAGFFGGFIGALALPVVSLILLPKVAVGRIVLETSTGTSVGAAIGLLGSGLNPLMAVAAAIAGFAVAAIGLRLRVRGY